MSSMINFPIVLEVKVKKVKFITRLLVIEKDRIMYFDLETVKQPLFTSPIDDCEIFDKQSEDKSLCELHLISRSK